MLLRVLKGIKLLSQRVTSDDFCISFWLKRKLYTAFTVSQDTNVYRLEELNKVKMENIQEGCRDQSISNIKELQEGKQRVGMKPFFLHLQNGVFAGNSYDIRMNCKCERNFLDWIELININSPALM